MPAVTNTLEAPPGLTTFVGVDSPGAGDGAVVISRDSVGRLSLRNIGLAIAGR